MKDFKFELGLQAKDIVTGFKGTIASRIQFLTGCNRYCIEGKSKSGGKPINIHIDENAIELTKGKKIVVETDKISGGPNQWEEL